MKQDKDIVWHHFQSISEEKPEIDNTLDNDAVTLEKDRNAFQSIFTRLSPVLRIDHIERDCLGRDVFVLNTASLDFIEAIKAVFSEKKRQYEVGKGYFKMPVEGKETSGIKPSQLTVAISRLPLKKLNRSLPFTILGCAFCIALIAVLGILVYRIVFV